MMRRIKRVLIFLVLTFNIVLTQDPSASFESDVYSIGEHLENYSVTLEIENPELLELWAYNIFLYADTSIIKLTDATWHSESPFEYTIFNSNAYNDTLKIMSYTANSEEMYSGEGGGILDIAFDIVGEAGESTLLEFTRFEISDSYIENTIPTNIILVAGVNCNDPTACNYNVGSSSDTDCIPIPDGECCIVDDCSGLGDCDGNVDLGCGCGEAGPSGCDNECGSTSTEDDCGYCGGDNSSCLDCAGIPNGEAFITPCGDCSFDVNGIPSTCDISDISVSIATMDNNFRSNHIEIPISLSNYEYIGLSDSESDAGLVGLEFIIRYDPDTLFFDANKSIDLIVIENFIATYTEESTGEITGVMYYQPLEGCEATDSCGEVYSWDGPFASLSFDIIESTYNPELHGNTTDVEIILTEVNTVDVNTANVSLSDTGTLTIYTKACIDPFASTFDSNFICDCTGGNTQCENDYNDTCDDNGILEGSHIFNDGCNLPDPDFADVLSNRIGDEELIIEFNTYTLIIPEGSVITFPNGETSLDLISSAFDNTSFLPDVALDAKLAGPLVGLYPFGTTFEPPLKFLFTFEDLSRGTSEYKILYMDDIQTQDWEEIGICTTGEDNFRYCYIEELSSSGLFIVMYGENLEIDESIIPTDFNLYRSYPNPFNPTTTLEFDVANSGIVNFTVYNINGRIVDSILSKFYTPGNYQIKWEAQDFPTGIYLIQMRTASSTYLQKVMLLK